MVGGPSVALLGTGIMGAGMARNLMGAGLPLTVWNRTAEKAAPLAELGAHLAADPAEAVTNADVIVTMLRDGDTAAQVIDAAAAGLTRGQVWAQTTTVGPRSAGQLAEQAAKHGLTIVDAPVLGTKSAADSGQLLIFAAGPKSTADTLRPVFDAIGRKTVWLDEDAAAAKASRLKLVANSWVLAVTSGTAEALALAKGLDVDPADFLDAIDGGPLDLPYLRVKAAAIVHDDWEPSFSVDNAAKDADLIVEAARASGVRLDLAEAVSARMRRAAAQGHGDRDLAANYFASFGPGDESDSVPRSADPA